MSLNFEALFESIQLISENVVKDIKFDLTKFCTIVDDSERKNGKYLVEENSTRFYALSDSQDYKKGDNVRVSVPNGDFDDTKYIIGKVVSKSSENTLVNYVSPLETVIDISGNLFQDKGTWSIKANGEEKVKKLGDIDLTETLELQNREVFETLSISADFRTLLSEYRIISGTFGICVILYNELNEPIGRIDLDSSIMFGNPYRFGIYTKQENKGNIKDAGNISRIELFLYQNGDFEYLDGEEKKQIIPDPKSLDTIWVKNVYIGFGSEVSNIADNTLVIYTNESLNYNSDNLEENYERKLRIIWYNKNEETNEYIGFGDWNIEEGRTYELYWYRYSPNFNYGENEKGFPKYTNWEPLGTDGLPTGGNIKPSINNYFTITLNDEIREDKFKAVLVFKEKVSIPPQEEGESEQTITTIAESNELIFVNTGELVDTLAADANNGALYIEHGNSSQAVYTFYDEVNIIDKSYEALRQRELYIRFNGLSGKDNQIDGATVYWYVPNTLTMLNFDKQTLEEDYNYEEVESKYEGYTCYSKTLNEFNSTDTEGEGTGGLVSRTFLYKVKDYYTPSYKNNTIICEVIRRKITFKAEVSFTFSTKGIAGTDYTLVVAPMGNTQAAQADTDFEFGISLYDPSGNVVGLDMNSVSLKWEGVSANWGKPEYKDKNKDNILIYSVKVPNLSYRSGVPILEVTVKATLTLPTQNENEQQERKVDLISYYPIPYSNGNYFANSPSFITYTDNNTAPFYQKDPYELYTDTFTPIEEVKWEVTYHNIQNNSSADTTSEDRFLPELVNNRLSPKNLYISNATKYIVVWGRQEKENILWAQPIKILKNRYLSTVLNVWNGNLSIDKDNNTIFSAMVGAGKKNDDNSFSGVVMGEFEKLKDGSYATGLRGYHEGEKSFEFDINGTATLGKSGKGQIKFNGNSGGITSASYIEGSTGMEIDLDDGYIDIRGVTSRKDSNGDIVYESDGASANIRIDAKSPYFAITSPKIESKNLIYVAKDDYYLQSDNYKIPENSSFGDYDITEIPLKEQEEEDRGTRIDLQNGNIDSYNLTLRSKLLLADSKVKDRDSENNIITKPNPFFVLKNIDNKVLMYAGVNVMPNTKQNEDNEAEFITIFTEEGADAEAKATKFFLKSPDYTYIELKNRNDINLKYRGTLLDLDNGFFTTDHFYIVGRGAIYDDNGQLDLSPPKLILNSRNKDYLLTTYDEKNNYGITITADGVTKIGGFILRQGVLGSAPKYWDGLEYQENERLKGTWGYYIPSNYIKDIEISDKLKYKDRNDIVNNIIWQDIVYNYGFTNKVYSENGESTKDFTFKQDYSEQYLVKRKFKTFWFNNIEGLENYSEEYQKKLQNLLNSSNVENNWRYIPETMYESLIKDMIHDSFNIVTLFYLGYKDENEPNLPTSLLDGQNQINKELIEYYFSKIDNNMTFFNEEIKNKLYNHLFNPSGKENIFIYYFKILAGIKYGENNALESLGNAVEEAIMKNNSLNFMYEEIYQIFLSIAKAKIKNELISNILLDNYIDSSSKNKSIREICEKIYNNSDYNDTKELMQELYSDNLGRDYAIAIGGSIAKPGLENVKNSYDFFPIESHPFRVTQKGQLFIGNYEIKPELIKKLLDMAIKDGYVDEKYSGELKTDFNIVTYPDYPVTPNYKQYLYLTGVNEEKYNSSTNKGFWISPRRAMNIEASAIRVIENEEIKIQLNIRLRYEMCSSVGFDGYREYYQIKEYDGSSTSGRRVLKGVTPENWYKNDIVKTVEYKLGKNNFEDIATRETVPVSLIFTAEADPTLNIRTINVKVE